MKLRILAGVACAVALAAPAGIAFDSGGANAATVNQSCVKLAGNATISPGLTTVPQNVTITAHGTLTSCTPSAKTGGGGTITATIKQTGASCQKLASGGTFAGSSTTKWKNAKTSAGTFKGTTTSSAPTTATISGKMTSGLFSGNLISGHIQFTPGSGNCTPTSPIKSLSFTSTYGGANHPFTVHT
jgi:hypothetical protein